MAETDDETKAATTARRNAEEKCIIKFVTLVIRNQVILKQTAGFYELNVVI